MSNQKLGQFGEEKTCAYLESKGYKILERNYRNKLGEIDIIAKDYQTICFIEVKTRFSSQYGAPFESVNTNKQRRMVKLALTFLKQRFRTVEVLSRFDVISIKMDQNQQPIVEHIQNAFDLTYISD